MKSNPIDPRFRVSLLARTPDPQRCVWAGMHQDYSEGFVADEFIQGRVPSETTCGEIAVKRLVAGDRGHYGPLEHPAITLNVGWFPHTVMQQARTHRVGISFDVQSGRYTGDRIIRVALDDLPVEEVFYFRPVGLYTDREGAKYQYTEERRDADIALCKHLAEVYYGKIQDGFAEEHARGIIPYDIRQHFVVSFNLRSALHFMDLRAKLDAQYEIRQMCELTWPHIKNWAPQIAEWYENSRLHKARLAP